MQDYFKIPVKNGYIDVNTAQDTPINLIYDNDMQSAYVLIDYKEAGESWEPITQAEFEAKLAEIAPIAPDETEAVSVGD